MDFILTFIITIVKILKYAILLRILMSWIRPMGQKGGGKFNQILHEITEPILKFFRNLVPRIGMIDLSPILAFFALDFAQLGLISLISSF